MSFKLVTLAATSLVLSGSVNAALMSVSYDKNYGWWGDSVAEVNPNNGQNGIVIGMGSNDNGVNRANSSFLGFDSSLGSLTAVSLTYEFSNRGNMFGGAFSSDRVAGVSAEAVHHGIVNYGFDSAYNTRIEDARSFNSVAAQEATRYSGISVPWNTTQLWTGYYAREYSGIVYSHDLVQRVVNFDSSLFDNFTNQTFGLEVISSTEGAGINGCNYLSTCGMDAWSQTYVTNAVLTYTYETSTVPVPAAVWLFGSGLLGMVSVARRKKA